MKKYFVIGFVAFLAFLVLFFGISKNRMNDYYEEVNKEVFRSNHIKKGSNNWSYFKDSTDAARHNSILLFDDVLEGDSDFSRKVEVVYHNMLNQEKRDKDGLAGLMDIINLIYQSQNMKELERVIDLVENELGINILMDIEVYADYEDTSRSLIYLSPVSFAFGSSADYFANDDYMAYKAYLKRAIIKLLQVYGYEREEAKKISLELVSFYEDIASSSMLSSDLGDVNQIYHKVGIDTILSIYSNVDILKYFKDKDIQVDTFNLIDAGEYKKINAYFCDDNLELWQHHLLVMILSHYASYLSSDYKEVVDELSESLGGEGAGSDDEKVKEQVMNLFSENFSSLYAKRYKSVSHEKYLQELFLKIKNTYRELILDSDYISDEARKKAIDKLKEMRLVLGEDNDASFSFDGVNLSGNLVQNIKEIQKIKRKEMLMDLSSDYHFSVDNRVVNAYYHVNSNAIYVPASIYSLIDLKRDEFFNLGAVGMILAHEVSHAFDFNGSNYDAKGNFSQWWTDDDYKYYQNLKKKVALYYSSYEVLPGRYIDGEKTINENIADMASLECLGRILADSGATRVERKKMYQGFASVFASQETKEYKKMLLLIDTHAPNKYRVNAVLSSNDMFYSTYRLSIFDGMYIPLKRRIRVW
mgnify:FL=1